MMRFARTDRSVVSTWWWTVDRVMLSGLGILALVGVIVVFAASPPVAATLRLPHDHFIIRHIMFLLPAIGLLFCTSLLAPRGVLRLAIGMFVIFGLMLAVTPIMATEIKGARRWISVLGTPVQPSEFVKPALVVVTAFILSRKPGFLGFVLAAVPVGLVLLFLLSQPDLGMTALTVIVFSAQLFVAGLPWFIFVGIGGVAVLGLYSAFHIFAHFHDRVVSFLDPNSTGYQVEKALRAVASGGLFGRGPGEGLVKFTLPDAHTDFVFAATAEEFGILACLMLVSLFAFMLIRGLNRATEAPDRFCQLAATGLIVVFASQALINMAVNLNLMPTKGMTLPFVSYGGSSMLALALGMGMLLALTRQGAKLGTTG